MSEILQIEEKFEKALSKAKTLEDLESVRREFTSGKGSLDALLKNLKNLPVAEKQKTGLALNSLKEKILKSIQDKKLELEKADLEKSLTQDKEDPTLPSYPFRLGRTHPITRVLNEVTELFLNMGFGIAEGPEIETDENNFGCLNIPPDHPARDMHDTFYVKSGVLSPPRTTDALLLRTHTSPVQIRQMKSGKPPVRIIAPGKVYRHEAIDATHSSVFHQVEGLVVDRGVSFADLKGTLEMFAKELFGKGVQTRFRPSFFPFVEPGAEMDISWGSGWLEMLGAGMVHPEVFKAVGYNPEEVTGFAFGMGIERIAMVRYGISDMRLFYENHLDFLKQF